jgi:hypothetical protein
MLRRLDPIENPGSDLFRYSHLEVEFANAGFVICLAESHPTTMLAGDIRLAYEA